MTPRWFTDNSSDHSRWYAERFRGLVAEGADLGGEARLVDALIPAGSTVLDAGCGTGRVGALLHARGHHVTGVDLDPVLIAEARSQNMGPRWIKGDLLELDLGTEFDAIVVAGNVMVYLAPGTESRVVSKLASHLAPGGSLVAGFRLDRHYSADDFDDDLRAAGLRPDHRFESWNLCPFHENSEFAVVVARNPA